MRDQKHGRLVFTVVADEEMPRDSLVDEEVLIDGKKYKVLCVESYALDSIRKGHPIGLLVKEVGSE